MLYTLVATLIITAPMEDAVSTPNRQDWPPAGSQVLIEIFDFKTKAACEEAGREFEKHPPIATWDCVEQAPFRYEGDEPQDS